MGDDMSKKNGRDNKRPTLPDEVRSLITRKLRYQRHEQEKLLASTNQAAYSKLHEEVLANIRIQNIGKAFTSVPLSMYKNIVASATAMTKEWPGIVWKTIASILSTAQVVPRDRLALNKIVDEFAWVIDQNPFTLSYIDPEQFMGVVRREAGRFGFIHQDDLASFNRQLELKAAAAQCGILNSARQAREGIGIAIDEYVLAQPCPAPKLKASTKNRAGSSKSEYKGAGLEVGSREWREQTARKAANAKHDQPGGNRDKQQRIRGLWATGKYSSRDRCAEEECAALGMSYKSARNALVNTPKPNTPPRC